jgi:hypothetical protein
VCRGKMRRRLNNEVQQASRRMVDLQGGSVSMPFARSGIWFVSDPVALFLRQSFHAGAFGQIKAATQ